MKRPNLIQTTGALFAMGLLTGALQAEPRGFAYNGEGQLFSFDLSRPSDVIPIGAPVGPDVKGIDLRPGTNVLYAIDVRAVDTQLYSVDPATGVRTPVGAPFLNAGMAPGTYALNPAASYGLDFNPTTLQMDGSIRIRFVNSEGQDLRLHSDTGQIAAVDGTLAYDGGNPAIATVAGAAYINTDTSRAAATMPGTQLYYIESSSDNLVTVVPPANPNLGVFTTVGSLGVLIDTMSGFDIYSGSGQNKAYLAARITGSSDTSLHTVNLTTGAAGPALGLFPAAFQPVGGFAILDTPDPVLPRNMRGYSYTANGQLFSFDLANPASVTPIGTPVGVKVKGLDFRPGTKTLYTADLDDTTGQVFAVNPRSGARAAVGAGFANAGMVAAVPYDLDPAQSFGFDFNPTTLQMDSSVRIRFVSGDGTSLRLHSDTGVVAAVDGNLGYAGGVPAMDTVGAAAYTNSDSARTPGVGAGAVLYYLDTANDQLVNLLSNPNGGQFNAVGPIGLDAGASVGLDIVYVGGSNLAYAVVDQNAAGVFTLHRVNLITGDLSEPIGTFPAGYEPTVGLAIAEVDATAPVVRIRQPARGRTVVRTAQYLIRGTASDDVGVNYVIGRVAPQAFRSLQGTTNWISRVRLRPGVNVFQVRAYDAEGNFSNLGRSVLVRRR